MKMSQTSSLSVAAVSGVVLVTGAAGFIGSRLCEVLLEEGHNVRGIDCFTTYYDRSIKERNLLTARAHANFQFFERNIATDELADVVDGVTGVLHLAAMPGLVRSWVDVDGYCRDNIVATAKLLEAVTQAGVARFVQTQPRRSTASTRRAMKLRSFDLRRRMA